MVYKGFHCFLRPACVQDTDMVLSWENDIETMVEDRRMVRYSREEVEQMLRGQENSTLQENGQCRFIIETAGHIPVGMIDLFDYMDDSCDVGILVFGINNRRHSYGRNAVLTLNEVAREIGLKRLVARIHPRNMASLRLFRRCGYVYRCTEDQREIYTFELK